MQQIINYIIGVGGIVGGIITVYKVVTKPNIAQDQEIIKMDGRISYNQKGISDIKKKTDKMDSKLDKIMNNHLAHLGEAIARLEVKVETLCNKSKE